MKRLVVLVVLLAATPLAALDAADGYVYTNEDLDRLGTIPVSPGPVVPADDPEGWRFVFEFIEREQRRLDADRSFRIEEARVDEESFDDDGYATAYYGLYPYPYPRVPRVRPLPRAHGPEPPSRPDPGPVAAPVRIGPTPAPSTPAHGRR